tara:strand:- start:1967 stop:4507 length:2541 start_codon:yes stop_codon:yes gene_type:complete
MGFDGLISFLIRNLPNDAFDDIDLKISHNKILSKYVLIDISFILYNCYLEVEEEINNILKYICALSCSDYSKVINLIEIQLLENHWKNIDLKLDGSDKNEICKNFIKSLSDNNNEILDNIMIKHVFNKLRLLLSNIFAIDFVSDVVLFFDSIPSYSKILEQRKRRLKNYLESQNRKEYYKEYFTNLKNKIVKDDKEDFEYDYFSWISNKYNCNKIIDSNSNFIKKLKEKLIHEFEFYKNDKSKNSNKVNKLDKLESDDDNLKIKISFDEEEYGEADYKIFKYISRNNIEDIVTILSCDSDLVYQIITQQLNYDSTYKDIKLNLCKFYINSFEHCQHYSADKIISIINSLYVENNSQSKSGNFCLDLMVILNFFGNDLLPSSFEIGPELNLNSVIKFHYNSLGKYDLSLIENSSKTNENGEEIVIKILNFNNLKKLLLEINKSSIFTKIILLRFYKVPYNIVSLLTDKLNFDMKDIKKFLEEYLIFKGYIEIKKKNVDLDENDIRLLKYKEFKSNLIKKLKSEEKIKDDDEISDELIEQEIKDPSKIYNYSSNISNLINQLDVLLDDYLDYSDYNNYGLLNNCENFDMDNNMYQNLYNYISSKSSLDRSIYSNYNFFSNDLNLNDSIKLNQNEDFNNISKNKSSNDKNLKSCYSINKKNDEIIINFDLEIHSSDDEQIENYLLVLYYIIRNFFNDMCDYKSTNLTVYKFDNVPSLKDIIEFLDRNNQINFQKVFEIEIKNNILSKEEYFNPILHHLIITPYLLESNYLNLMNNKDVLNQIIMNFDSILSNIWSYECYTFDFLKINKFIKDKLKYIDPKLILESWKQILFKVHNSNKLEYEDKLLIDF